MRARVVPEHLSKLVVVVVVDGGQAGGDCRVRRHPELTELVVIIIGRRCLGGRQRCAVSTGGSSRQAKRREVVLLICCTWPHTPREVRVQNGAASARVPGGSHLLQRPALQSPQSRPPTARLTFEPTSVLLLVAWRGRRQRCAARGEELPADAHLDAKLYLPRTVPGMASYNADPST